MVRGERSAWLRGIFGTLTDKVLLASWVFCYAALLWAFEILKKIETRRHAAER